MASDELQETADYEKIIKVAKEHVANNSYKLIETLAYNIATEICAFEKVSKAAVTVHKPEVARMLGVEDITAKAKVKKEEL